MRISLRLNSEYDDELIKKLELYKDNRNLSKLLRKFIREGFNSMSDALTQSKEKISDKTEKVIKWPEFPK